MSYTSIFNHTFDLAIYGSGYAAFAAALKASDQGLSVLLFHRRFEVLWESGRGLATEAGHLESTEWTEWFDHLSRNGWSKPGLIDCAGAEILACATLREKRDNIRTLLQAYPIEGSWRGNTLRSVVVGTKSGRRQIRAKRWIDASDEAALFRLSPEPRLPMRTPSCYANRTLVMGLKDIEKSDLTSLPQSVDIEKRPWENEYTVCFRSDSPMAISELANSSLAFRDSLEGENKEASIILLSSPIAEFDATEDFPHGPAIMGNLVSASPALTGRMIRALADRFSLGLEAVGSLSATQAAQDDGVEQTISLPITEISCEILVAGTGTGGAMAALTAQREGAQVVAIDTSPTSGGISTDGFISTYFHGQPGGFFEELDAEKQQYVKRLDPCQRIDSYNGSVQAKKLAFALLYKNETSNFLNETLAYDVTTEHGRVTEVMAATATRLLRIKPAAVIDSTGDGDLAALAGARFEQGRPGDGLCLSYSQACWKLALKENKREVGGNNFDVGWADPTDPEDLTRARLTAITLYRNEISTDDEHILQMAPTLGIRQSRNFITLKRLGLDDLIRHTDCPDSIGQVRSPLDTHSIDFAFESDEVLFWLWACKHFRGIGHAGLPFGALLLPDLDNLCLACRALGASTDAAYAVRVQRDVQRMAEAAAYASIASTRDKRPLKDLTPEIWRDKLAETNALSAAKSTDKWQESPLEQLDKGLASGFLWTLYQDRTRYETEVLKRLASDLAPVSWLAATVVAMWGDERAEPRLIHALQTRERGQETPHVARGAFNQWIDVPNWFLAINLLRICGTEQCLPSLFEVAFDSTAPFDLRCALALTLERLVAKVEDAPHDKIAEALTHLLEIAPEEAYLSPSRSIYRSLLRQPQLPLPQEPPSVDTREDHYWQLALVVERTFRAMGLKSPINIAIYEKDERAVVRQAFDRLD